MPALAARDVMGTEAELAALSGTAERSQALRPTGHRFEAEVDVSELDERTRPGPAWNAKTAELSRSHVVLESRRMCYPGRILALAIHLIDDRPVPLLCRVVTCQYSDDGLYRVDVDLLKIPDGHSIYDWALARGNTQRRRA
ncbi:MAG: hypothetical protein U0573_11950 [Phycisphaerales bacterium]|nr:hypothetical protein [Planctomycetota bacterium]